MSHPGWSPSFVEFEKTFCVQTTELTLNFTQFPFSVGHIPQPEAPSAHQSSLHLTQRFLLIPGAAVAYPGAAGAVGVAKHSRLYKTPLVLVCFNSLAFRSNEKFTLEGRIHGLPVAANFSLASRICNCFTSQRQLSTLCRYVNGI